MHPASPAQGHRHQAPLQCLGDVATVDDEQLEHPGAATSRTRSSRSSSRRTTRPGARTTTTTPTRIRTATPAAWRGRVVSSTSASWSPGSTRRGTLAATVSDVRAHRGECRCGSGRTVSQEPRGADAAARHDPRPPAQVERERLRARRRRPPAGCRYSGVESSSARSPQGSAAQATQTVRSRAAPCSCLPRRARAEQDARTMPAARIIVRSP